MLDDQPVYMTWKLLWKHGGENLLPVIALKYSFWIIHHNYCKFVFDFHI